MTYSLPESNADKGIAHMLKIVKGVDYDRRERERRDVRFHVNA